jgi:hypothetical protein
MTTRKQMREGRVVPRLAKGSQWHFNTAATRGGEERTAAVEREARVDMPTLSIQIVEGEIARVVRARFGPLHDHKQHSRYEDVLKQETGRERHGATPRSSAAFSILKSPSPAASAESNDGSRL